MSRLARASSFIILSTAALIACGEVKTSGDPDAPVAPTATLIVTASGNGGGVVVSAPGGINCGTDCSESFAIGTAVTLTATADAASSFVGWSGGGCTGTAPCTVTLGSDAAVIATFARNNALVVTLDGTGGGTVTSADGGIDCGTDCTENYPAGAVVTLTPAADAASTFTGWADACTGTGSCTVTVDQMRTVRATFTRNRYTLSVMRSGGGSGTVSSSPAGISCGTDCTEEYDQGTVVTLTAMAAAGSSFVGWSDASCPGTGACTVTLAAATTITANFSLNQNGLTVMKTGTGAGTVTSSPAGITCGTDCSELYNFGTVVTLTAAPAAGSTFGGWSGGGCMGTGTCTTTVNAAVTISATFTLTQHTLTVTRTGTGTGTVTSSPAGIACGADCTEVYNYGTVVMLTAAPTAPATFAGWSGGGCMGTGTCTTTITGAATVTATFTAATTQTLTVTRAGTGLGTVTSSPAGILCGPDCSEAYNTGTVVTLSAGAGTGSIFAGWSGACTGTGACTVTMNAAVNVSATFNCAAGSQTMVYTGGLQTFTVPSCVTRVTLDARGAQGGHGGALGGVGGRGARAVGTFTVTGGQQLRVLVGGAGVAGTNDGEQAGGTGGGGTFVVDLNNNPLIIAGGGGGAMGRNGLVVDGGPGQAGTAGAQGQTNGGVGGVNGNGGTTWPWTGWHSGTGGGGFFSHGVNDSNGSTSFGTINQSGRSFLSGGAGGIGGSAGRNGGYGGGGSAGFTGGGGGGYSGGGSGTHDAPGTPNGGGGGSINNGTTPSMVTGFNSGNGALVISW